MTREFGRLSPADFEDLSRDLIGRAFGVINDRIAEIEERTTSSSGLSRRATTGGVMEETFDDKVIEGSPDPAHISTSYVEVHNKTMRMHMRRFTRLTNGHSKKVANHAHMVALYTLFYNFIRTHGKLRMSPAMAAGIATTFMSFEDVVARIDAAQVPKARGFYKPKISN